MKIKYEAEVINAVLNYLLTKPYQEVNQLIEALMQGEKEEGTVEQES